MKILSIFLLLCGCFALVILLKSNGMITPIYAQLIIISIILFGGGGLGLWLRNREG